MRAMRSPTMSRKRSSTGVRRPRSCSACTSAYTSTSRSSPAYRFDDVVVVVVSVACKCRGVSCVGVVLVFGQSGFFMRRRQWSLCCIALRPSSNRHLCAAAKRTPPLKAPLNTAAAAAALLLLLLLLLSSRLTRRAHDEVAVVVDGEVAVAPAGGVVELAARLDAPLAHGLCYVCACVCM